MRFANSFEVTSNCADVDYLSLNPTPLQITVDGDTSTNDCVIGMTSGSAGNAMITDANSTEGKALEAAVTALLQVNILT